jgi:hypothetical protein
MSSWKDLVRSVAPALATALGGPVAGIAVKELGVKLLGKEDASESEIAAAVASGGSDVLIKLKELDQQFATRMTELGIDLEKIAAADRSDARAREVARKDLVPSVLAYGVIAAFIVLDFMLISRPIPESNRDAFNLILGAMNGSVITILTYYFGSSRGSAAKDEVIGQAISGKGN